jgi:23S rRNA (uracil1939-C5)-methyltransferase
VNRLDCPKQERCPGCPLGGDTYQASLEHKATSITRALGGYECLAPELLPTRAASPTHAYRLRAKLVVEGKALGLYERGSHRVLDVTGCRVLSPELTVASDALRQSLPLPIYGADLRATSEGVLVTLLTDQPRAQRELERVAHALVARGVLGVAISVRAEGNLRLLAGEPEVAAGPPTARHRLSPALPYAYAAPGAFVQAHAGQASYVQAQIIAHLRERAGGVAAQRVLELFAGNGGLALALAREGAEVTAVESYAPAIALAERAATEQALRVRAVAGDATSFTERAARSERFDAAIVNPPRRGLTPALRKGLAGLRLGTLAYVSCNPRTLARDCAHLHVLGLRLRQVEPLDMIPWSDAVEALCWLEPAAAPAPRVLFENEAWLAVEKSPEEAVSAVAERVRLLRPDALSVESWGSAVSGVCWFAKTPASEQVLRNALRDSERELVVLVRGNLRKQGTITRRASKQATPGTRYKKLRDVAHHSLAQAFTRDADETGALRDFAGIGRPVLGDAQFGDRRSNEHVEHRHGLDRPFVHCRATSLRAPDGSSLHVESELAPDLVQALGSFESD